MRIEFTEKNINEAIKYFETVFDIVRVVDPIEAIVYMQNGIKTEECERLRCFEVWNKCERCENCISARVIAEKNDEAKFEFIENAAYYVISKYISIDGKDYVLELVNSADDEILAGAFDGNEFCYSISCAIKKLFTDELTNIYNRRYFNEQLFIMERKKSTDYSIAVIDVDKFKFINDVYGHSTGDIVLMILANIIKEVVEREKFGFAVRYSGDEFVIVFKDKSPDEVAEFTEEINRRIEKLHIEECAELKISVSIGVCSKNELIDGNYHDIFKIADKRMYEEKEKKKLC